MSHDEFEHNELAPAARFRRLDHTEFYAPELSSLDSGPCNIGDDGRIVGRFHRRGHMIRGMVVCHLAGTGIDVGSGRLRLSTPIDRDDDFVAGTGIGGGGDMMAFGRLRQSSSGGANSQMITGHFDLLSNGGINKFWMMVNGTNSAINATNPFTLGNNTRIAVKFWYIASTDGLVKASP